MQPVAPTLLCIDDNPDILRFRRLLLESRGYRVLSASGGPQGIQAFRTFPVDLVILDYDMPFMDGAQVATELRRLRPSVPILMSTGHGAAVPVDAATVDAVVSKDQPNSVLLGHVEQMLSRRPAAPSLAPVAAALPGPAGQRPSPRSLMLVGSLTAATAIFLGKAVSRSR